MRRPRGQGLASKICDVLADAPRPMFLGEIESTLDFKYQPAEIMSVLVKLRRKGKLTAKSQVREGPGRREAKVYALSKNALEV